MPSYNSEASMGAGNLQAHIMKGMLMINPDEMAGSTSHNRLLNFSLANYATALMAIFKQSSKYSF